MATVYFVTHPEVVIDPVVPVPSWQLSKKGVSRMQLMLRQPWINQITAIYSSQETKALESAAILAAHRGMGFFQETRLGEIDRSSTGYLPSEEFERVLNKFFECPDDSIFDWESASDAQTRIINAVNNILAEEASADSIAIISHGGVGTLLLCFLAGYPIARRYDQPGNGGGNYYVFDSDLRSLIHGWRPIDELD